jgi:carbamoyl-phosphate synthase large subunit
MNEWKNKRVFISGGSGVIGTALVDRLIEKGASLFVGDLKPMPEKWSSLKKYREGDLISLSEKEIRDFAPEVFFHLAATFERSIETADFWQENFHHNILLSHHLLSLQKDLPSLKQIIFASSYLIYNPNHYLFQTPQNSSVPLVETTNAAPRNLCGMAKMLHEQELLFVKKFRPDLQIINARIFRSYGKNSRDIISRWIRALIKNEPITIYCPEGRFDFIYAEDVAKGLLALAETDFNGTVNLGSGKSRSIHEVLDILRRHFGDIICRNEKADIPFEASEADMSLFHQLSPNLSFQSLEEAIPQLIAFEKQKK